MSAEGIRGSFLYIFPTPCVTLQTWKFMCNTTKRYKLDSTSTKLFSSGRKNNIDIKKRGNGEW
jgi:hypothetical protein